MSWSLSPETAETARPPRRTIGPKENRRAGPEGRPPRCPTCAVGPDHRQLAWADPPEAASELCGATARGHAECPYLDGPIQDQPRAGSRAVRRIREQHDCRVNCGLRSADRRGRRSALSGSTAAGDLRSKVDFASWAKSPGSDGRLVDIQEWSARESATATASAPPGDEGDCAGDDDAGKDFVDLGVERRFTEAAVMADARAQMAVDRGFVPVSWSAVRPPGPQSTAGLTDGPAFSQ